MTDRITPEAQCKSAAELKRDNQKAVNRQNKELRKAAGEIEHKLSVDDERLLKLLKSALTDENPTPDLELSAEEWDALLAKADRHAVLSLLYDALAESQMPQNQRERLMRAARKYALQNYRLSYCTHQMTENLKERGITAVVLKGVTAAAYYPTPELRKSGDIDMLIPRAEQMESAREALLESGFAVAETQLSHHHIVMYHRATGIEAELHSMLAEPFDNSGINKYLENCLSDIPDHIEQKNIMGYDFPVLKDGYQAYELLLHMLQHFLRSGFGLKLLCDWVCFWNRPVDEEQIVQYLKLVRESGLYGFSRMITSVCVIYLGLDKNSGLCGRIELMDEADVIGFAEDLLEAEEFGKSGKDRMVALRGTSLVDYFREFHHAMCLNFPKVGKVFLLWPVLWCITLFRFLRNNRRIRGVTTAEILKKAGKRSERMKSLELFKTQSGNVKN